MFRAISYDASLKNTICIDVRTTEEFLKGHIPGAINIPILDENERAEIGTLFKAGFVSEAKRKGLVYGAQKLATYFDFLEAHKQLTPHKDVVFYCARGGYRSRSVVMTLKSIDLPVYWLEGGYKKYRSKVNAFFEANTYPHFIVLHGLSGSGKTRVLNALKTSNAPILDLEACANHKGSHLGSIGTTGFQSQQQFENCIFETIDSVKTPFCFIESESKRIGQVFIPSGLFEQMKKGTHVFLSASLEHRIQTLIDDYRYAHNFKSVLSSGIEKIKTYMSTADYLSLLKAMANDDYWEIARLLLEKHYDPIYQKSVDNYHYQLVLSSESPEQCADTLMKAFTS